VTADASSRGSGGAVRTRRIGVSALWALLNRGVSVLVSFVSVPLTVTYLGAERYGAWVTISSLLAWLQLADLGLGNGLTNALADAFGRDREDLLRAHVASAFWILTLLAAALGLGMLAVAPFTDWPAFLGVTSPEVRAELSAALAAAAVLFLASFPLVVVDKVLLAYQEGGLSNVWSIAASLTTLAAIAAVAHAQGGMLALVLATAGARVLVTAASAAWLFHLHRPALRPALRHFDGTTARGLLRTGLVFFGVQVAALVLFNTDNIVIAHVLGPGAVTPYSVAWRLFTIPTLAMSLVFPYLWSAYAEALARGDHAWVAKAIRWSTGLAFGVALAMVVPLVLLGEEIIRLWAGPIAEPPSGLLAWMGAWACISAAMNAVACAINATGRVKALVWYGLATALLNIALSVWWAHRFGLVGVIAGTVVAYAIGTLGPAVVLARRLYLEESGKAV
jgi:O-antigen/teichoic acid export membrane protein